MLPVWFIIGLNLLIYGELIFFSGIYELSHPVETVLANLHAPIWWDAIMTVLAEYRSASSNHTGLENDDRYRLGAPTGSDEWQAPARNTCDGIG